MMHKMFHSIYFYLDWFFAMLGLYLIAKFGPNLKTIINNQRPRGQIPWDFLLTFILLGLAVGGCMYLTTVMGDKALIEIGLGNLVPK